MNELYDRKNQLEEHIDALYSEWLGENPLSNIQNGDS
jgi:hypothetical protein